MGRGYFEGKERQV